MMIFILSLVSSGAFAQNPFDLSEKLMQKMIEEMKAMDSGLDHMMKNLDDDSYIGKKLAGPSEEELPPVAPNVITSPGANFTWSDTGPERLLSIDITNPDKIKIDVRVDKDSVSVSQTSREEKKVPGQGASFREFSSEQTLSVPPDVDGSAAKIERQGTNKIVIRFPRKTKESVPAPSKAEEKLPVSPQMGDRRI
jgi:HSP20 family molecular chaperone IbpA